ncbi:MULTISPECIES: hypothetical protein [Lactobacillus]|uniref:Uncharacterized protein n=1 Tax=Lactobacillus bombicola TaxID=1505723 RepID=A0A396SND4_9LACO|nr:MULTISPECIES: hypothetical protein [Lactobacillus]RHW53705.1 hypothetical protein DS835_07110 [Lactobacillus bombicola]RMC50839.1 hypothetical protein F5ESL0225_04425 [Lactobacillus sp. ESL0225]
MNTKKQENLIIYFKYLSEKRKIEYHLEKSIDNSIYFWVYSDKDFLIVLQWLGLVGAFFTFSKTAKPDEVHDFMYDITITDYGYDMEETLRMASDNGVDLSKYLK